MKRYTEAFESKMITVDLDDGAANHVCPPPCTPRRMCCPMHCASYCAPRQPRKQTLVCAFPKPRKPLRILLVDKTLGTLITPEEYEVSKISITSLSEWPSSLKDTTPCRITGVNPV